MVGFPVMKLPELSAGRLCSNSFVCKHCQGARINTVLAFFICINKGGTMKEKTYSNGQVEQRMQGGKLTYFFKDGNIKAEGPIKDNLMDGLWHYYRENGIVWQVGSFKHGVKHGPWVRYDRVGAVEYEAQFEDGKEIAKRLYH